VDHGGVRDDFVEKFWPLSYGHNRRGKYPYPSEGNFPVAMPAGWLSAGIARREAGLSYTELWRISSATGKTPKDPARARVKGRSIGFCHMVLTNGNQGAARSFRNVDLFRRETRRPLSGELNDSSRRGKCPICKSCGCQRSHGRDHRSETHAHGLCGGKRSRARMVVEAVSHPSSGRRPPSSHVEDDAQNGPGHVDAHRTIAFVFVRIHRRGRWIRPCIHEPACCGTDGIESWV